MSVVILALVLVPLVFTAVKRVTKRHASTFESYVYGVAAIAFFVLAVNDIVDHSGWPAVFSTVMFAVYAFTGMSVYSNAQFSGPVKKHDGYRRR